MENFPKVELHIHLDGTVMHETSWELAQERGIAIEGVSSLAEFKKKITVTSPGSLTEFLDLFSYFLDPYVGSIDAIRRMAKEFADDRYKRNIIYCEARFCPDFLKGDTLTNDEIVAAVLDEFKKAEERYNNKIKLRVLLCCIRPYPEFAEETVDLCIKYKDQGVVGIDMAGDEHISFDEAELEFYTGIYERAKANGIHITIHAGESGTWKDVALAREKFHAERIGHGYHTLENTDFYQKCLADGVHFEMCPLSSYLTQAVVPSFADHPLVRFHRDGANYSINSDDPTVTNQYIEHDFKLMEPYLGPSCYVKSAFNAAHSCFLPPDEKAELLDRLREAYKDQPEYKELTQRN